MKIKKGDTVQIITGNDAGKSGRVIKVFPEENKAVVEGANLISKHTKPNAANPEGGIVKQEAKIHISNLMLIDPKSGEPTKVGKRRDEKTGKLVRVVKKTGEVIK